ncbi:helix-turn-helix transcriptional regulator [Aminipila butyrica]|uniref:Helix-turn-helix transcriptional regulator n=1 Tax=Aminipila butyrica TaxID=433296 RepID=A0A858BSC2_9FIRM|nr:metalloregulator ArsR/SmtB family transcription factor [Aminipila butyrica]QIB67958.1 helix-turn-helix transcriptional regulator [Aminipila butyrica]
MCAYEPDIDRCDCNTIHEEVVNDVREHMPEEDTLLDLADIFKVFSDSTRVKILYALFRAEMCVCDIAVLLGTTKSSISHQLRILKQVKLVKYRKDGRVVYYSLADEHVKSIFKEGLIHVCEK